MLEWRASGSRGDEGQGDRLSVDLTVFEAVGQHPQSESFDRPKGVASSLAVGHDTRKAWDLCNPAAVLLLLELDDEFHDSILPDGSGARADTIGTSASYPSELGKRIGNCAKCHYLTILSCAPCPRLSAAPGRASSVALQTPVRGLGARRLRQPSGRRLRGFLPSECIGAELEVHGKSMPGTENLKPPRGRSALRSMVPSGST